MNIISIIIIRKNNIDLPPDKSFDNKKGKYVQSKTTLSSSNNKFNEC